MVTRSPRSILCVALAGCAGSGTQPIDSLPPLDLAVALAPGQARAGVVVDERALWGGISAEAQRGDIKLYNDRVRFAIQGARDGSYYIRQGGHVVDADIVRPPDQPGEDLVDEWLPMAGLGRLIDAVEVEVVDDGRASGVAVVRATGGESPLELLEGAVEAPGALVQDFGLQIVHTYRLPADAWLLEVTTEVTATDTEALFNPGDVLMGAFDAADWWGPGRGYAGADNTPRGWNGYLGERNEGAIGLFSATSEPLGTAGLEALSELIDAAGAFDAEPVRLAPGASMSWTRYYGVGPDFATLTDAWLAATDQPTQPVGGVVRNPEGPVAGARVTVVVGGEPFTLAVTGDDGSWSARVPQGAAATWVVDGAGPGWSFDLPPGAPHHGPYAATPARDQALAALERGARPIPLAEGLGTAEGDEPLGVAAALRVVDPEGRPFELRLAPLDPLPAVDDRFARPRPSTYAGWTADGDVTVAVPPGRYQAIAHRGPRFERHVGEVDLVAGQTTELPVALPQAFEHPGWMWGDPHVHGSPSADTDVPMTHRLLGMAGCGVQLHFGTDHDHVVDYTVLLAPLGLAGQLNSVVATEMSPVMRGHLNLYPLQTRGDRPNGGAFPWWSTPVATTSEEIALLRERHGGALTATDGFVVQSNHPASGLPNFADYADGVAARPDFFSSDLDAIEVLNSGDLDHLPYYLDFVNHGLAITPTGVSDSHGMFSGSPGFNGTWIGLGTDDPAAYTDDALREAFLHQRTIPSNGVFLDASIEPGRVIPGPATLEVTAHGASWAQVDRLHLYRDGVVVQTVEGPHAAFLLAPDTDASFVVIAEGDTSMAPISNQRPWAMTAAIKIDVAGDGWTPPGDPIAP